MDAPSYIRVCTVAGLVSVAFCLSFSARAHIVPVEEFHPMAEAYRRTAFVANLNPVPWELIREDAGTMSDELSRVDPEAGAVYRGAVYAVLANVEAEARISVPTPTMRKESSRSIFQLSTVAVAEAIRLHLSAAERQLNDYDTAWTAFDAARQIWAAFEHEVKATDKPAHRSLGQAWLACAGALGSPGVGGVGATPPDMEIFSSESSRISQYLADNFGPGFQAPESGRLVALPTNSPTFDRLAEVPPKLPPGSEMNKQLPRPRQILNMAERGVDERDTTLIALGDMVFDSPYIFGEPARSFGLSCNTCHNKGVTNPKFFIPGISSVEGGLDVSNGYFATHANNGHYDPLDIPDLRGIRFTAPYGRNGRFASLREFSRNVIVNEFNGPEPDPMLLDGMVAYLNEFDFLPNSYLNRDGTLNGQASEEAKRGEKLFQKPFATMGGKSCATCHVPSNHFMDGKRHDIGTVTRSNAYARDGALDTPTLLSSAHSQPYFHDGSQPTLQGVVEWFNEEFGLELKAREAGDLTAYLETVGHGEEAYEDTLFTLESELEEFSFFLSSYEFLKARNKPVLIQTLFQTISTEIQAHKWDVQDATQMPLLNELARYMDEAYEVSLLGDDEQCDERVEAYRAAYEKYGAILK